MPPPSIPDGRLQLTSRAHEREPKGGYCGRPISRGTCRMPRRIVYACGRVCGRIAARWWGRRGDLIYKIAGTALIGVSVLAAAVSDLITAIF